MEDEAPELIPDPDFASSSQKEPVPITILTGWLGSGKTTLLTHLVKQFAGKGKTIAIVQNEASSLGVEDALRLTDESGTFGEMLELGNGCVCCTIRSDFVTAVEALLKKRRFDYVVLECSGLADPGPLASLFWVDDELGSDVRLDGIIGLADAANLSGHLRNGQPESAQVIHQLSYADRIILNKLDLVSPADVPRLTEQLRNINPAAPVICTERALVDTAQILNIRAFEAGATVSVSGVKSGSDSGLCCPGHADPDHDHGSHAHAHAHAHPHDDTISTFVVEVGGPTAERRVDLGKLRLWLAALLWQDEDLVAGAETRVRNPESEPKPDSGAYALGTSSEPGPAAATGVGSGESKAGNNSSSEEDGRMHIFRMKAILAVHGEDSQQQYFMQAVQQLFDIQPGSAWGDVQPHTRLVVIGRRLQTEALQKGFESCLVAA